MNTRFPNPRALAVLGAIALVTGACSSGVTANSEGAEGTASAAQPPARVISLNVGASFPPNQVSGVKALADFFIPELKERVEQNTPHSVEVSTHFGTLVTPGEELQAVEAGQLDIATVAGSFHPAELALMNVPYYVPFGPSDMAVGVEAMRNTVDSIDEFGAVFESFNQKPLGYWGFGDSGVVTTVQFESLDELAGKSIVGAGPNLGWLEPAGIVPVSASGNEWYTMFQTGVVEGGITFPDGVVSLGVHEVATQFMDMHFGVQPIASYNINLDTWNSLPNDVQDIVLELGRETEQYSADLMLTADEEAFGIMQDAGLEIREPTDQLRMEWANVLADMPAERAKELDSEGLPGTETVRTYIEHVIELGHDFPVEYEVE